VAATFVKVTKLHGGANALSASGSVTATASNALLVATDIYYSGSAVTTTLAVTGAGTWTTDGSNNQHFGGTNDNLADGFASNPNTTGGTFTLTVTWGGGMGTANTAVTVFVYEFSGMPTSSILDSGMTPTGSTGAASPVSTASVTNANAADVMLAIGSTYSAGLETQGSPSNSWTMPANANEPDGTQFVTGMTAYKIVSASASQSTTWTDSPSVAWSSFIIAYKSVIAAAQDTPELRHLRENQMQQLLAQ
jgi:hypothetical protein